MLLFYEFLLSPPPRALTISTAHGFRAAVHDVHVQPPSARAVIWERNVGGCWEIRIVESGVETPKTRPPARSLLLPWCLCIFLLFLLKLSDCVGESSLIEDHDPVISESIRREVNTQRSQGSTASIHPPAELT